MTQTDVSYKISYSTKDEGTYLIVDTVRQSPPQNGWNEKKVIFTIKDNIRFCDVLYGETLDFMEYGEIIYTKCMINEKEVSVDEYETKKTLYDDCTDMYLLTSQFGDEGKQEYISYSKLIVFFNFLDRKADKRFLRFG